MIRKKGPRQECLRCQRDWSSGLLGKCHVGGTIQGWYTAHLNLFETEPKEKNAFQFCFHRVLESVTIRIVSAQLCESSIIKSKSEYTDGGLREVSLHQICILDLLTASRPFRYLHYIVLSLPVSNGRQARALCPSLKFKHGKAESKPRHRSICWAQQRCGENAGTLPWTTPPQWWLIYHDRITHFHSSQPCAEKI